VVSLLGAFGLLVAPPLAAMAQTPLPAGTLTLDASGTPTVMCTLPSSTGAGPNGCGEGAPITNPATASLGADASGNATLTFTVPRLAAYLFTYTFTVESTSGGLVLVSPATTHASIADAAFSLTGIGGTSFAGDLHGENTVTGVSFVEHVTLELPGSGLTLVSSAASPSAAASASPAGTASAAPSTGATGPRPPFYLAWPAEPTPLIMLVLGLGGGFILMAQLRWHVLTYSAARVKAGLLQLFVQGPPAPPSPPGPIPLPSSQAPPSDPNGPSEPIPPTGPGSP